MRIFKYTLLIICIYIYIYNPIFSLLGFGLNKVLLLISIFYIFFVGFTFDFLKCFKNEILFTLILIFYTLLLGMQEGDVLTAYMHMTWFLEGFLIPTFLILFFKSSPFFSS